MLKLSNYGFKLFKVITFLD